MNHASRHADDAVVCVASACMLSAIHSDSLVQCEQQRREEDEEKSWRGCKQSRCPWRVALPTATHVQHAEGECDGNRELAEEKRIG